MTAPLTQVTNQGTAPGSGPTEKPPSLAKKALRNGLKVAFAIGLIYWMVAKGALDMDTVGLLATPGRFAFLASVIFFQIYINNYRWLVLLRGQGFETSIRKTLPLSFIGMFFNFAMPGGVGGDVVKGYYILQEHPRQKFAAAISIFMDRMVGFFIMIMTAFLALFYNWSAVSHSNELTSVAIGVSLLFFAFLVFYFLSLSTLLQRSALGRFIFETLPGGGKIRRIYEALHSYRRSPVHLASAMCLSLLNQITTVAFVVAVAWALGETRIPIEVYFFLVPVGVVVQALPISPAGIGVGQAAFYFLFNLYLGERSQLGPTAATAMQLVSLFWGFLGAFFYLRRKKPDFSEAT